MQQDQFNTALRIDASTLPDLREPLLEIRDKYPWFTAAHVLVCKADHMAKLESYEENLRTAALYVNDREALFDLLMKDRFKETVERFEKELALHPETDTEEEQESKEAASADESIEVMPPLQSPSETEAEQMQEASVSDAAQQEETNKEEVERRLEDVQAAAGSDKEGENIEVAEQEQEVVREDEENEKPRSKVRPEDLDDLQREMVVAAISSTIQLEQDEEEEAKGDAEDERKSLPAEVAAPPAHDVGQSESVDDDADTGSANHSSFTTWLLNKANETHWHEEERKSGRQTTTPELSSEEETAVQQDAEVSDKPSDQRSLIDAFIQKDPKITPKKSEMFSSENLAKTSLVDDEQWVTETMAEVYAAQGKIRKAVKAYKLLSLKYPEKSIYFANRIKKLRESGKSN